MAETAANNATVPEHILEALTFCQQRAHRVWCRLVAVHQLFLHDLNTHSRKRAGDPLDPGPAKRASVGSDPIECMYEINKSGPHSTSLGHLCLHLAKSIWMCFLKTLCLAIWANMNNKDLVGCTFRGNLALIT